MGVLAIGVALCALGLLFSGTGEPYGRREARRGRAADPYDIARQRGVALGLGGVVLLGAVVLGGFALWR
ncbi:hypothetical protein AB0B12_26505 [Streptomyces sp. NPDC044780]|uniref:Uncharacterized protein n=1 Tax=Streptomyces luomodiensis TaxID=3026192 RepID=A0ABY9UTR8_9ACTN|nr:MULTISPECIES: hypothetical protein [unclassified Streptomyces]WAP55418.1 hypothetical protein N6H00_10760 [Streptomyces sp. S465]WNE95938.1 hypothetical protein PS467_11655 [Streptomyces sp. SCA4-21]